MEENSEQIGKEVIINYINAFNNRDYIGMADLFNFPHIRFANEKVGVISREEYLKSQNKVSELLYKEGWDHTQIKKIETIQNGPSKSHYKIHFIRYDKNSKIIHDFTTLWIVTKLDNHWGIQFRSSFLISNAATFGKSID
jgi:hypothetical protein|tara:strand:+ start:1348 stop:1767 length:420 start_codon:yes stop_codon:yes gene_type:complete